MERRCVQVAGVDCDCALRCSGSQSVTRRPGSALHVDELYFEAAIERLKLGEFYHFLPLIHCQVVSITPIMLFYNFNVEMLFTTSTSKCSLQLQRRMRPHPLAVPNENQRYREHNKSHEPQHRGSPPVPHCGVHLRACQRQNCGYHGPQNRVGCHCGGGVYGEDVDQIDVCRQLRNLSACHKWRLVN